MKHMLGEDSDLVQHFESLAALASQVGKCNNGSYLRILSFILVIMKRKKLDNLMIDYTCGNK